MTLVYLHYDPVTEFNHLFEDALFCPRACRTPLKEARRTSSRHSNIYRPRLDIHESGDTNTVTVTFELPGLTSEAIAIDVQQNRLTVSGEAVATDTQGERKFAVRERRSGKFSRTLQLPFGTKPEDVKAKMENGILTVTFPKISPEQHTKRIVIQ